MDIGDIIKNDLDNFERMDMLSNYSDKYFLRTQDILNKDNHNPIVLMQIFQRNNAIVCGIDEVIGMIRGAERKGLKIMTLKDGDEVAPWETMMTIEGDYRKFADLETVYLGILARRTKVCTNISNAVKAANDKPVLFFAARFDYFMNQEGDGYAADVGGASEVSTDANGIYIRKKGIGTMPHALIAAYGGDTALAALKFDEYIDEDINRVVLVDFENDCIGTTLKVLKAFSEKYNKPMSECIGVGKGRVYGVRFDTSANMVDKIFDSHFLLSDSSLKINGVCPNLCFLARKIFDENGLKDLKIIVSGGFSAEKIRRFEDLKVPVDVYCIGSSAFKGNYDFTADIVMVNGKSCAKVGRKHNPNPRLKEVVL